MHLARPQQQMIIRRRDVDHSFPDRRLVRRMNGRQSPGPGKYLWQKTIRTLSQVHRDEDRGIQVRRKSGNHLLQRIDPPGRGANNDDVLPVHPGFDAHNQAAAAARSRPSPLILSSRTSSHRKCPCNAHCASSLAARRARYCIANVCALRDLERYLQRTSASVAASAESSAACASFSSVSASCTPAYSCATTSEPSITPSTILLCIPCCNSLN